MSTPYLGRCDALLDRSETDTIQIVRVQVASQARLSYTGRIHRDIPMILDLRDTLPGRSCQRNADLDSVPEHLLVDYLLKLSQMTPAHNRGFGPSESSQSEVLSAALSSQRTPILPVVRFVQPHCGFPPVW